MSLATALENLLQQAGYGRRRAKRMADWIDQAAIPGMSADDLYSAFLRWKTQELITAPQLRKLGAVADKSTNIAISKIEAIVRQMLADQVTFGPLFTRAAVQGVGSAAETEGPQVPLVD